MNTVTKIFYVLVAIGLFDMFIQVVTLGETKPIHIALHAVFGG